MTGFFGADTAQLRAWSDSSASARLRIDDVIESCARSAHAVTWVGSDADRFRAEIDALRLA